MLLREKKNETTCFTLPESSEQLTPKTTLPSDPPKPAADPRRSAAADDLLRPEANGQCCGSD
jgi:hypothetical protein